MAYNPILDTDSYKISHYVQFPEGISQVSSYIEARKKIPFNSFNYEGSVFFGLQAFIKEYLRIPVTQDDLIEAEDFASGHMGIKLNLDGWKIIIDEYHGYLPIEIWAIPEGSVTLPGTPQVEVVNTDPRLPWLTPYIETALLRAVWYPSTVATLSREVKRVIARYLVETTGSLDGIAFMLHDFGARGVSSRESSALGGMAHLVNFQGSDTIEGIRAAKRYYGHPMAAFSVPATEHSTVTSWGKARELDMYANMLEKFPTGIVSIVADSYDIFNATENLFGDALMSKIVSRGDTGGKLVIRPDSGDAPKIVVELLHILAQKFGFTTTKTGYKQLPPYIGLLWGDGIDLNSIPEILRAMKANNFAASNIVFGMGGGLLQKVDRDTLGYAMKASEVVIYGERQPIFKEPSTDKGKRSKAGCQRTENMGCVYSLVKGISNPIIAHDTFSAIRERAAIKEA